MHVCKGAAARLQALVSSDTSACKHLHTHVQGWARAHGCAKARTCIHVRQGRLAASYVFRLQNPQNTCIYEGPAREARKGGGGGAGLRKGYAHGRGMWAEVREGSGCPRLPKVGLRNLGMFP